MKTCTTPVIVLLPFLVGQATGLEPREILSQADTLADQGNWEKARTLYAQAESEFHKRGDRRNELYAKFGRLHRDVESGSYTSVLRQIEIDLKNPLVESDPNLKIRALSLKGTIDLNVNTAGAEDDFTQILNIAKSQGDQKWENRAAGELGIVAGLNGDLGRAAVILRGAIDKAAALHDVAAQVNFSLWLANGMALHGMADRALQILDGAVEAASRSPGTGVPIQLHIARIRSLMNLPAGPGAAAGRADARRLIDQTLAYARQNKILGAQTELLNQAGLLALEEHSPKDAEKYFEETASVARQADLPRMRAEALLHLCELDREQGRLFDALRSVDNAIAELRRAQEAYDLPLYLAQKAEVEAQLGHVHLADELFDQATQVIEAMLVNAPSSRVKSSMIAAMGDVYLSHVRLAVTRFHDPSKAFAIVEAARGRALADSLRYSRTATPSKGPPATAEVEISRIQKILRETSTSPAETRRLLARLDNAYNQLVPAEYVENREEMKRLYRPVSLVRLQQILRPGEAIIEYILDSREKSYALELTRGNVQVHPLPPRGEIDKRVYAYLAAVKNKHDWAPLARSLFDQILAPAISSHPTSITIVPDGSLHLLPFASLMDADSRYAMTSMPIASAPSATVFCILRTAEQPVRATRSLLGIAATAWSQEGAADSPSGVQRAAMFDGQPLKLPPLPYALEEVTAAAAALGNRSVLLSGDQASEAAVKAQPLNEFKVIHIAAHGVGNVAEPDRAALVLAPGNGSEDGLWQSREIRRTRLAADLVTLSACETGVGRLQGEEGIMNMARTFLVAGAKSVVASLWDTDDRFTATLMGHFYRHIAAGETVAQSLRLAQTEMLSMFGKDAQPYYWAGFTVIGDGTRKVSLQAGQTNLQAAR